MIEDVSNAEMSTKLSECAVQVAQIVNRLEENIKREIFYVNDKSNEPVIINTVYPFNYYIYKDTFCEVLTFNNDNNLYKCKFFKSLPLYTLMGLDSRKVGSHISNIFDFDISYIARPDIKRNGIMITNINDVTCYNNKIIFISFNN